ncbi:hypothetical protein CHS0354_001296 [Potamilus streckersoni]|uniref:Protein phosphatase methylesterase 1 n=1 Tax=Potamilus streckersoni TaxID=2493646 RepID=A0AAE0VPG8_9BIVA|nr:hypothetical protein CHS0354_001296 [Potamilus streckersoni]
MSALQRQAVKHGISGGLPPMPPSGIGGKKLMPGRKRDYTPVLWDKYFQHEHRIKVNDSTFRVYECGNEGPVVLFLHGGGFSALSWAVLSSVLSNLVTCRCAAIDLRGHGDTYTSNDSDLSAETMSRDVGDVVRELYGDDPPQIILIGHSMGGAIAVHTAEKNLIPSLIGLVVIDVVEGTALEALSSMQNFLRGRPSLFKSLEHAIEWCVRSGQIRNLDSARVSMVGQMKRIDTNETASSELEHQHEELHVQGVGSAIREEEEEEEEMQEKKVMDIEGEQVKKDCEESQKSPQRTNQTAVNLSSKQDNVFKKPLPPQESQSQYTWRIDLSKTEKYWKGWFEGLSKRFLSIDVPKMLLLAGVDRLDKELTIGQMQGKFQMQVLPQCGHAVHEDVPDRVADCLASFMVRYKVATPTADFQRIFPGC